MQLQTYRSIWTVAWVWLPSAADRSDAENTRASARGAQQFALQRRAHDSICGQMRTLRLSMTACKLNMCWGCRARALHADTNPNRRTRSLPTPGRPLVARRRKPARGSSGPRPRRAAGQRAQLQRWSPAGLLLLGLLAGSPAAALGSEAQGQGSAAITCHDYTVQLPVGAGSCRDAVALNQSDVITTSDENVTYTITPAWPGTFPPGA